MHTMLGSGGRLKTWPTTTHTWVAACTADGSSTPRGCRVAPYRPESLPTLWDGEEAGHYHPIPMT